MAKRKIGQFEINPIGLGCMGFSHGYGGRPDEATAIAALNHAIDIGYDFLDTAAAYGMGANERLVGKALRHRRDEFTLASKCALGATREGGRAIDGTPEGIALTLDQSLERLGVDHIDLYYLHRRDPNVPIEESIGALARGVEAGKIRSIGVSEISSDLLRRAHATHPIAAIQTEYSLWTRNPEIALLDTCRELGVTFVSFSPVGRGFLAGAVDATTTYEQGDMRGPMPRFNAPNLAANLALLDAFRAVAADQGCTIAQLAIAWVLARDPAIVTIPGTTNAAHMDENMGAQDVALSPARIAELDALINQTTVSGSRYTPAMQSMVSTEEFA
ncbi:aldo/keto reductase [Sphingomonas crocodyli]|uniref:Aldo/keto reductase n=1 Tax=Sphingomonas crocodyli TaxID=1979270 RepID=A0A437M4K0_9SPHN|nr:aldo/keto reductase [Sphingomonas crocodyli]RVT92651.1 aldo/keto reductase [Sphingomonas crocodyli]